jgi:uncharacterized protein (DUF2336 family)
VVHALANDQPDVAAPILQRSPLLLDADLVEAVASGEPERQIAIATRAKLPCSVSAAIAEVGCAEACLLLLENEDAETVVFSLDRIVQRFGHLAAIRDAILSRDDLPAPTRQALVCKLSETLADFVTARGWLGEDRACRITREACEPPSLPPRIQKRVRPKFSSAREVASSTPVSSCARCCRAMSNFEEALADLAQVPLTASSVSCTTGAARVCALYDKAGLPASTFPAFREALEAMREEGFMFEPGNASRLKRRIIERTLTRCESEAPDEIEPLLTLLRRYAAEAAREEARLFCDELVSDGLIAHDPELHPVAA